MLVSGVIVHDQMNVEFFWDGGIQPAQEPRRNSNPLADLTAFVGRNDSGKSSIVEALEIFFNEEIVQLDREVANKHSGDMEVTIGCVFSDIPDSIVLDVDAITSAAGCPVQARFSLGRERGANFGSDGTVTFTAQGGTTTAWVTNWTSTTIAVLVPLGAVTGNVTVTVNGETSNGVPFLVTHPNGSYSANCPQCVNPPTGPAAPSGLVATAAPDGHLVGLNWIDNATDETSYRLGIRGAPHPPGDGPFRKVEAEHLQFTMDVRGAPGGILGNHLEDQVA